MKILRIESLTFCREEVPVFTELNTSVHSGEVLFVEGPNGSGKTTILKCLAGFLSPTAGKIYWDNQLIQEGDSDYFSSLSFLGHKNAVKIRLSPYENCRHGFCSTSLSISQLNDDKINAVLSKVGLSAVRHEPCQRLSAGQNRRTSLAKLFLAEKKIWLLDEPLTTLDESAMICLQEALENHLLRGGLAVISTHHLFSIKAGKKSHLVLQ